MKLFIIDSLSTGKRFFFICLFTQSAMSSIQLPLVLWCETSSSMQVLIRPSGRGHLIGSKINDVVFLRRSSSHTAVCERHTSFAVLGVGFKVSVQGLRLGFEARPGTLVYVISEAVTLIYLPAVQGTPPYVNLLGCHPHMPASCTGHAVVGNPRALLRTCTSLHRGPIHMLQRTGHAAVRNPLKAEEILIFGGMGPMATCKNICAFSDQLVVLEPGGTVLIR